MLYLMLELIPKNLTPIEASIPASIDYDWVDEKPYLYLIDLVNWALGSKTLKTISHEPPEILAACTSKTFRLVSKVLKFDAVPVLSKS